MGITIITVTTLNKYVAESRTYTFDFSKCDEIVAGDTITTISSLTASPNGLTIGAYVNSGKTVQVVLSGGTSGTTYTVTCIIVTSSGAILEGVGYLQVS